MGMSTFVQAGLEDPDSPYSSIDYSSKTFSSFTPTSRTECNSDLLNTSTLDRYLYVIQYYVSQVHLQGPPASSTTRMHQNAWMSQVSRCIDQ